MDEELFSNNLPAGTVEAGYVFNQRHCSRRGLDVTLLQPVGSYVKTEHGECIVRVEMPFGYVEHRFNAYRQPAALFSQYIPVAAVGEDFSASPLYGKWPPRFDAVDSKPSTLEDDPPPVGEPNRAARRALVGRHAPASPPALRRAGG